MTKFSIPNIPSFTSTSPNLNGILFVPNLKVISSFMIGDLSDVEVGTTGFADIMNKKIISNNLRLCKNIDDFEMYRKITNIELPYDSAKYFETGKIIIEPIDIKLPISNNYSGMKAFEKTIIQSLLETQKPYMEIFKGVSESMIKIEDIIACVLAVTGRSLKPIKNPRALGYKKNKKILMGSLNGMDKLSNYRPNINPSIDKNSDFNINTKISENTSIEYSTGTFDPEVNYEYKYERFKEEKVEIDISYNEDIIDEYKPPVCVFGVFNSLGKLINEDDVPQWIKKSGKYFGQFNQLSNYTYGWVNGRKKVFSNSKPKGIGWIKETYLTDTVVNGYVFNKGEDVIYQINNNYNVDLYRSFFDYEVDYEVNKLKLSKEEENDVRKEVNDKLNDGSPSNLELMVSLLVSNNYLYGYDGVLPMPIPRSAFVPKKINYNSIEMYLDPESEYDMKVIKIDKGNTVKYWDVKLKKIVENKVVFFDTRTIDFFINDIRDKQTFFSAELYNNNVIYRTFTNTSKISIPDPKETDNFVMKLIRLGNDEIKAEFKIDNPGENERITYELTGSTFNKSTFSVLTKIDKEITNKVIVFDPLSNSNVSIDMSVILNNSLINNKPYSDGVYGEDIKYNMGYVSREPEFNGDDETYYIIEGILSSTNDNFSDIDIIGSGGSSGRGYYKVKDVVKAMRKFISLVIMLSTKVFPPIKKGLELISNPSKISNFIVDIIRAKIGDDFGNGNVKFKNFSSKFTNEITKNISILNNIKQKGSSLINNVNNQANGALTSVNNIKGKSEEELKKATDKIRTEMEDHLSKSPIKDYFYVSDNLDIKCLLDGKSIIDLFGFKFGIGVFNFVPKIYFPKNILGTNLSNINGNKTGSQFDKVILQDSVLSKNISNIVSKNVNSNISVIYSTGEYIDGVDYDYTYVNESTSVVIDLASNLINEGDITGALKVYEKGIIEDPSNEILLSKYQDTLRDSGANYLYELGLNHPLLDMLLGLVSTPIKIVKSIIEYILSFFKSLKNPFSLPNKIIDFVSFKWLLKFLSKEGILKALGITINIKNMKKLLDSTKDIDLSTIVFIPFLSNLPKFSPAMFGDINLNSITAVFKSIFQVIENVINMLIDLFWAIMGLAPLLKKRPYLNISNDLPPSVDGNLTEYVINMILGKENDFIRGDVNSSEILRSFVYDIKLPDGRTIKDLDRDELDIWINENKNLDIELNF